MLQKVRKKLGLNMNLRFDDIQLDANVAKDHIEKTQLLVEQAKEYLEVFILILSISLFI